MQKVQQFFVLALIAASSCTQPADLGNSNEFGSPYEIVTNVSPPAPDEPPAILSDSLSVRISYMGGCSDHAFEVFARTANDSAWVRLRHDDGGDACEEHVTDRLMLPLPEHVLQAQHVYLLNPNGDVPFALRWKWPSSGV